MTRTAIFFFSTGRCGTQWLAEHLGRIYGDLATVAHEPLHLGYRPRELYGIQDKTELPENSELLSHRAYIRGLSEGESYFETGWPCWAAVPFFISCFPGRVRIVHLTRHPVHTAISWVSHGVFCPPFLPGLHPEKVWLSPFDQGVQFTGYRERWAVMTPYEKALFFWAEVHSCGLRLETQSGVPWLRIRYEDLFSGKALPALLDFMALPRREEIFSALQLRTDKFRYIIPGRVNVGAVKDHPDVIQTAVKLGYDVHNYDEAEISRRYFSHQGKAGA